MDRQQHRRLLREQQQAYRKLNDWEVKERLKKLPNLSIDDALAQYFQLLFLSSITDDKNSPMHRTAQIKRRQKYAALIHSLKDKSQQLHAESTSSTP